MGDPGSVPGLERSLGQVNGYLLQCSCLENSKDGEPGGLQSMGLKRVRHDSVTNTFTFHFIKSLIFFYLSWVDGINVSEVVTSLCFHFAEMSNNYRLIILFRLIVVGIGELLYINFNLR